MREAIAGGGKRPMIVAALIVVLAAFQGWSSWRPFNPAGLAIAPVLAIAAAGLLMRWAWAAWLVVAQAVLVLAFAVWIVGASIVRGWVYPDLARNVISLIPITVWLLAWTGLAFAVRRRLRPSRTVPSDFAG